MQEYQKYISFGRVLEAHNERWYARQSASQAKKEIDNLSPMMRTDFPEGGGTGWESGLSRLLKGTLNAASTRKVYAEKRFKSLRLTLIEQYPELTQELDKQICEQLQNLTDRLANALAEKEKKIVKKQNQPLHNRF